MAYCTRSILQFLRIDLLEYVTALVYCIHVFMIDENRTAIEGIEGFNNVVPDSVLELWGIKNIVGDEKQFKDVMNGLFGPVRKTKRTIITASQTYIIDKNCISLYIEAYGAGGGGEGCGWYAENGGSGGSGGERKTGSFSLEQLNGIRQFPVTIGIGGAGGIPIKETSGSFYGSAGGTSSFGTLISANGGKGGGNGNVGGGAGTIGGGGGSYGLNSPSPYGGGGGSSGGNIENSTSYNPGTGGTYGGNGGRGGSLLSVGLNGANGTDTRGIPNLEFIGPGTAGTGGKTVSSGNCGAGGGGGGGGYGGNGGNGGSGGAYNYSKTTSSYGGSGGGGGGGGYGGNGGNGGDGGIIPSSSYDANSASWGGAGGSGGGGGYGGNGGNGGSGSDARIRRPGSGMPYQIYSGMSGGSGGGGGYGKSGNGGSGGNGLTSQSGMAGSPGGLAAGGGGGGGCSYAEYMSNGGKGGDGLVIVVEQYYEYRYGET